MVKLSADEMRSFASKRIHETELCNTTLKLSPLALISKCIAHASAEKPIERRDKRRIEDVEVSADDGRMSGVVFAHRNLEFPAARLWMRENQVEAEHAHDGRKPFDFYVGKKSMTVSYARPVDRTHRLHKQSGAQRLMRHLQ